MELICSGITLFIFTFPPVIAAAHKMVPASILSGIIVYDTSFFICFIPSITISLSPAPVTFAPIFTKKFCKSTISGSLAAFFIIVVPSPYTEANIIFSVAPTLGKSKVISLLNILSQLHFI